MTTIKMEIHDGRFVFTHIPKGAMVQVMDFDLDNYDIEDLVDDDQRGLCHFTTHWPGGAVDVMTAPQPWDGDL